jgi:hypothetical protein
VVEDKMNRPHGWFKIFDANARRASWDYGSITAMSWNLTRVTYKGYRTVEGWEVAVKRHGQPLRLLDLPHRKGEWALSILADYLSDEARAAELHNDFAALTIRRFTENWELKDSDIDNTLMQVEILRARWRIALARG